MPTVTADSYGIDFTGGTDVTAALAAAINAQPSGNTFQLHANGLYLTSGEQMSTWTPTNVIVDGQGAYLFRNVRRSGDAATNIDILQFNAPSSTLKNLNVYGFRKDVYDGNLLATVAGSPTVAGTTVLLDAQNEEVRLPDVGLDWFASVGNYTNYMVPFYFRGVDGLVRFEAILSDNNHVASDCLFSLIDDSNNAVLASTTLTLTGTPTTYSLTFDPSSHLDRRMRVHVKKLTSTANTITVASITPYHETGYRRRGITGVTPPLTGGNEFSDGVSVVTASNVTFDNIWVEGPDGDGFNLTAAGANCTVQNSTVRCVGRQGYTIEFSTGASLLSCNGFEGGRSGIDFEPTGVSNSNHDTTITDCTFRNSRNYTISSSVWARCFDTTISNLLSESSGMGLMFGGGVDMTLSDLTHLSTTREEADRIANGGAAGIDCVLMGTNLAADNITTQFGLWIKDQTSTYNPGTGTVTYHPDNVNVTGYIAQDPSLSPPYTIDAGATNSSVTMGISGTNAFDVSSGLFVPSTVALFAPQFPATPQTVTLPGAATAGAFQDDAFQNEAFQDAASGGGYISYVGTPFTLSLTGQAVGAQVILGAGAGWDSDDITWDDTDTDWDAAGIGGQINQTGHVFAPSIKENVTVGLINRTPTLFAPSIAAKTVGALPIILRVGFTHTPQRFTEKVNLGLIGNEGVAYAPVMSTASEVELDLIDQTPVLFEFQLNPQSFTLPFINRSGFTYTPSVNEKVTLGLIPSTVAVFAPKLDAVALALINQSGVVFDVTLLFNPADVELDLIASTVEVFEPPLFNLPFQQTVRLDETTEQFINNAGIVFAPQDFVPAAPQFVFIGFINQTGHTFDLRVFLPTRPTIVLHARYDPVTVLKARYDPVTVKHAQNTRQG